MAEAVDVLFINPGDRKETYQSLGDEFSAIAPPVFAGLYATYVRGKGLSAAIYDAPALGASANMVAIAATEDFKAGLIVIVVYGLQPSASTRLIRPLSAAKTTIPAFPASGGGTAPRSCRPPARSRCSPT